MHSCHQSYFKYMHTKDSIVDLDKSGFTLAARASRISRRGKMVVTPGEINCTWREDSFLEKASFHAWQSCKRCENLTPFNNLRHKEQNLSLSIATHPKAILFYGTEKQFQIMPQRKAGVQQLLYRLWTKIVAWPCAARRAMEHARDMYYVGDDHNHFNVCAMTQYGMAKSWRRVMSGLRDAMRDDNAI